MSARQGPTRRALLVGAVAALVSACRPSRPVSAPSPAVDEAPVRTAIADELALLAGYDTLMRSHRRWRRILGPDRTAHEQHLSALRSMLTPGSAPSTPASSPVTGQQGLRTQLTDSARRLSVAAVAATAGDVAAVLASVAASHRVLDARLVVTVAGSASPGSSPS